jgi:membrane carboxypeptidase/penicillin-binding protein PbpC
MTDALGGEKTIKPFLQSIGMKSLSNKQNYGLPIGLGVGEISMLELAQSYMEFADTENVGIIHGIQTIRTQLGDTIFEHE